MEWIIAKTPGFENVAQSMRETRLAPAMLWRKANDLYNDYYNNLNLDTFQRCAIAEELVDVIMQFRFANSKSSQKINNETEINELDSKAQKILQFEISARDIMKSVNKNECNTALAKLENYAKSSPEIAEKSQRLASEIEYFHNKMKSMYINSVKKKTIITLSTVVVLIILGVAGFFGYKFYQQKMYEKQQRILAEQYEEYLRQKSNQGYDIVVKDGKRVAVWIPDRKHPKCQYLIASSEDGVWK
jgi:hypothetical protein